jgi:hypothetical protein
MNPARDLVGTLDRALTGAKSLSEDIDQLYAMCARPCFISGVGATR